MTPSVLLVCHSYPPVLGGSEIEAQRVCTALRGRGYRIQVVCAGGDPMPRLRDWTDPYGVPVRIYASRWKGKARDVVFALRVAGMLIRERHNYELVYFLMQGLHVAIGLPLARLFGKPILMKISGSGIVPLMMRSAAGRLQMRWLKKWAYRVMILNDGMRKEAIAEGFPTQQLYWMPNPVDTVEFAPASEGERVGLRAKAGIPAAAPVVLYVGRIAPEKDLPSLLNAFALVWRDNPEAVLVLVGDGPVRDALVAQANELGLPAQNVHFTGRVAPEDVCRWLKIGDLFALLSYNEGFPCALSEAMSAGLPSVVSDIPANRQLIDPGEHGFLVRIGDVSAIAAAINTLLGNAELRARMGQASRRRVLDNYSAQKVADRYEALLQETMAESR